MEKELFYFTLESESTATGRIYGEIGCDVIASAFCDELAYVESLGVTNVNIRIHSCGGNVVEGFGIFSAMLKSKATITTHNDGLAASTAGWLFLAGTAAVMADYSLLMVHNPSSPDTSKKGVEVVAVMRQSILTILSKRTGQDVATLSALMDEETWLNAEQALALGFATAIEETEAMIQLEPAAQTVDAMFLVCNSILNKNSMTENEVNNEAVTPEAPAVEVTNEAVTVEEPTTIITDEVEVTVIDETIPADEEKAELARVNAELTAKLAALESTVNAFQVEADKKAQAEKEAASLTLVTNAVQAGKIKAEAKAHWLQMATSNYDTTKTALESINVVNKTNPTTILASAQNVAKANGEKVVTYRDLDRNNPKELARIKAFEPAVYNELFFHQFGKYPAA